LDKALEFRKDVLTKMGSSAEEIAELLDYNESVFREPDDLETQQFPITSEAHLEAWRGYFETSQKVGPFEALKSVLPQFRFPIEEGMSENPMYKGACRRGLDVGYPEGLNLNHPETIDFFIHPTMAGEIPVLIFGDRADFLDCYRALTMRNEPKPIKDAVGAVIIGGYNNWDRILTYRRRWQATNPDHDWDVAFKELIPQKHLYKDRFILLSDGPYSGVAGADLGFSEEEWRRLSRTIRLEHECAHYFSKRILNSMRNNLIDELMADYAGIVAATGSFKADWFLRFLGLEAFPNFRESGRLSQYRGSLSDGAFKTLQALAHAAAHQVEQFDRSHFSDSGHTAATRAATLLAISRLTMEQIGSDRGSELLAEHYPENLNFGSGDTNAGPPPS